MSRYTNKIDENQPEIVQALERCGATVWKVNGTFDLIVGFQGKNHILEVKNPRLEKGGGRHGLTPSQVKLMGGWKGDEIHIVENISEALEAVGIVRKADTG